VELSERADIERALHVELASRFNQVAATPFCQDPLRTEVGSCAAATSAMEILRGSYTSDDINYWAAQLIPFLKQEIPTEEPYYCSIQQHIVGWKRVKECTSAGPSGIMIPHMKAHGRSLFLSNINTIMANLPCVHGFCPLRWRKGLDVMLEKKPGIRKINTLCTILLYVFDSYRDEVLTLAFTPTRGREFFAKFCCRELISSLIIFTTSCICLIAFYCCYCSFISIIIVTNTSGIKQFIRPKEDIILCCVHLLL
jgi:hypothetical protein